MKKKVIITILQAIVTVGLLYWVFHDPEKRAQMGEAVRQAEWGWLLLGTLFMSGMIFAGTQRWRLLLAVQGINFTWLKTWQIFMVGLFFNIFLPGGTGGDIIKIYYAMREVPDRKSTVFLSVIMDRVYGLLALMLVASVGAIVQFRKFMSSTDTRILFLIVLTLFGVSLVMIVVAFVISGLGWVHKLPPWTPMRGHLVELVTAFDTYGKNPRAGFSAIITSVGSHLSMFVAVWCAARSFGAPITLFDVICVMPVIIMISSLPISIAGMGVREKSTQQLMYFMYGIPQSLGVLISITGFLMVVFWGAVGGIVYLFYRPPGGHSKLRDIEDEVHELEDKIEHSS